MSEKKSFENLLEKLDDIVLKLEKGEAGLDELMGLYEEGVKIAKECNQILDKAEQKVTILGKNQEGEISEEQFEKNEER